MELRSVSLLAGVDQPLPSICNLHSGIAVTGFCPACLRERLASLRPPASHLNSMDLRRCRSFSYGRSAAAYLEPQRRSCDGRGTLFHQELPEKGVEEEGGREPHFRGENGDLRVGVRRVMRQLNNMPSSVISSHSMHLGVLATTSHAISTGTLFSVFYKARTS